jgi:hypothetical protein
MWPSRVIAVCLLTLGGCVDLSAVDKFAQTAPDVSKLDALTDIYVSDPATQYSWQSVWLTGAPDAAQITTDRAKQKATLDDLHALIVNYIQALGGLSGTNLTDVSAQAKIVSAGLTSSEGRLGLSSSQVSTVGDLLIIVPQNALNVWREHEIGEIIKTNQAAFHAMLNVETMIVQKIYILDFQSVLNTIEATTARMEAALASPTADPTARAAAFNFQENASTAEAHYETAIGAAQHYVIALQKLGAAYDILAQQSGDLSSATLQQILPLLNDASKAYADLKKL